MMVSDTPNLEWTDGVDTYGFPRWWALRPGESSVLFTRSDAERDYRRKDSNNRWRPKIGGQVRVRLRSDDGAYLIDAFVSRELVGVHELLSDEPPSYEVAWELHDAVIEEAIGVERI
jgi:hypothetical protein